MEDAAEDQLRQAAVAEPLVVCDVQEPTTTVVHAERLLAADAVRHQDGAGRGADFPQRLIDGARVRREVGARGREVDGAEPSLNAPLDLTNRRLNVPNGGLQDAHEAV